jgi:anti-anti-sigma regulatory factor
MLLMSLNQTKQFLQVRYIGKITASEFQRTKDEFLALMAEMSPGFTLLGDFSQLDSMDADCAAEIGRNMDLLAKAGVGLVIRVMPDPRKDIGLNILTAFHYAQRPRILTCKTLAEAAEALKLS